MLIFRNLWRRKTRTLLTLLGIAIGVAAVVALSAFGEGWATGFDKTMSTTDADLTVGQRDAMMLMLSNVDQAIGEEIKAIPGVDQVSPVVIGFLSLPDMPYFFVLGHDRRGFAIDHYRIIQGESLSANRQILIGKTTAKNFKKKIGDSFLLNESGYRVVGIYETGESFEDGGAVVSLEDAQRSFGQRHQVSYFAIKVKDREHIDEIQKTIETRWKDLGATRSGAASTQSEIFGIYRSFGWFLGTFAVLVGGLGMMNTTLMSVFERTREIGVLRAVGWRRGRIIRLIMGESLVLAFLGGLVGLALGIGLTRVTQLIPSVETLLSGVLTPSIYFQALGTALLLGTVGGIYPAWRASQLAPVEAMHQEGGSASDIGRTTGVLARILGFGAVRNLWRRPTRTLVTVFGIGIGVAFIVALIAIAGGFTATFGELGSVGKIDLVAEQATASDISLSVIDERLANRLEQRPDVKSVTKLVMGFSTVQGGSFLVVWGIEPEDSYMNHFQIRDGRTIQSPGEIILGRVAANGVKKQVDDTLRIGGSPFHIVGIFESGFSYEDGGAVVSLKEAQELYNKPRRVSFLGIVVDDPARIDEVARGIESDFPELLVAKTTEFAERTNDFNTVRAVVNALIGLTFIVGGIVMMNAMLMSVFERTQEIGVLRALGWRKRRVIGMVIVESLALSLLSGIAGIGMGVGLAWAATQTPVYGSFLVPSYSPDLFFETLALTLSLGLVGGIYPAWRASNLRPIEALRYE